MKSGTCPKCGSTDILSQLPLKGGEGHPSYVNIAEPEPPNRPFIWVPKTIQSKFVAYVCCACGYSELYAVDHQALGEGLKKGYRGS